MNPKDRRAHEKKMRKRRQRKRREGAVRGDASQEYVVNCLAYLQGSGRILGLIESKKNSRLDRAGIDIIVNLQDNKKCDIDVKSSRWFLEKNRNKSVLKFVPVLTKPIPEEAERLLREMVTHVKKGGVL